MPDQTAGDAGPEATELGPAWVSGSQSFNLVSNIVGQTFTIDVAPPPLASAPDRPLPVVFVLDGDHLFATVAQTARSLQLDRGGLPPMLIVGIGYRSSGAGGAKPPLGLRTRDLTPSHDARYVAMMRAAPPPFTLPDYIEPGGAADFLAFIDDELTPFLASRYRIDAEDRTALGLSLGGLFALHVLLTTPHAFRRYVALSPALWWDDRLLLREEEAFAAASQDLPAKVFMSVGALEEAEPSARMVGNLEDLVASLKARSYSSLRLEYRIFEDESHLSVFPAAACRGLRRVFDRNTNAAEWAALPAR